MSGWQSGMAICPLIHRFCWLWNLLISNLYKNVRNVGFVLFRKNSNGMFTDSYKSFEFLLSGCFFTGVCLSTGWGGGTPGHWFMISSALSFPGKVGIPLRPVTGPVQSPVAGPAGGGWVPRPGQHRDYHPSQNRGFHPALARTRGYPSPWPGQEVTLNQDSEYARPGRGTPHPHSPSKERGYKSPCGQRSKCFLLSGRYASCGFQHTLVFSFLKKVKE